MVHSETWLLRLLRLAIYWWKNIHITSICTGNHISTIDPAIIFSGGFCPRSGLSFRYMDPWFCFGFEITDLTFLTPTMRLVLNFRVSTTPNTTPLPDLYQVVLYEINFEVLVMFWNSIFQYLEMKRKLLKWPTKKNLEFISILTYMIINKNAI